MLFASIFIPDFSLQALFAKRPELRPRAIALVDGTPPLLRVVAANELASKAGVDVGQLKTQAESVGVETIARSANMEETAHASVLTCARLFSPRVQDKAIDLLLLDIAGLQNLFGSPEQIATKIRGQLEQEKLSANIAVAGNPDSAIIAARGFAGITIVLRAAQLSRLPINLLSPTKDQLETLNLWGITTFGRLAALDAKSLSQRLGPAGVVLQKLARGEQVHPFVPEEAKLEFKERSDLEYPVDLLESLSFVISSLLERICTHLQEHALATNELDCELALDPPRIVGQTLPEDRLFHRRTIKLPNPTTNQKLLLRLLQLDLQSHPPLEPVINVALRAQAVRPRQMQLGLFAPQSPEPDKLDLMIARLINLAGKDQVGSPQLLDTHRPRAFVLGTFAPDSVRDQRSEPTRPASKVALRLFEPVKRAQIRFRFDVPVHVSFDGKTAEVIEHSSPWLSSGEWWNELAYNRKEWDVQLRFSDGTQGKFLLCVNLRTNEPFVEGSYD